MSPAASWLWVFVGAGLGGVLRHGGGILAIRWLPAGYPFGTLLVNLVGSFLMGVVAGLLPLKGGTVPELRIFLATGLLGGFTTFSAFSLDTVALVERGAAGGALSYVLLSVLGSVGGAFAGLWLIRGG